jgi:hypothetical protein
MIDTSLRTERAALPLLAVQSLLQARARLTPDHAAVLASLRAGPAAPLGRAWDPRVSEELARLKPRRSITALTSRLGLK